MRETLSTARYPPACLILSALSCLGSRPPRRAEIWVLVLVLGVIVSHSLLFSALGGGDAPPLPSAGQRVGKTGKGRGGGAKNRERGGREKQRDENLCDVRSGACLVDTVGTWAWMGWFVGSVSLLYTLAVLFCHPLVLSIIASLCQRKVSISVLCWLVRTHRSVGRR